MAGSNVGPLPPRTRAWLWTACAAALVLSYLVGWTVYSTTHLGSYARYVQLASGVPAASPDGNFRLVSLVQTEQVQSELNGPQPSTAGAVWVVATVDLVPRTTARSPSCTLQLLGPGHRVWDPSSVSGSSAVPSYCDKDRMRAGRPYRFRNIFEVPARDADQIDGVVVVDDTDARPQQVLTPPR